MKTGQSRARWGTGVFIIALAMLLLITLTDMLVVRGPLWQVRLDAVVAAKALEKGDTYRLEELMAKNRGNTDFAYFFTSSVSPTELSQAVADLSEAHRGQEDPQVEEEYSYEQALIDLSGAVSVATHGTKDRQLPREWTTEFIVATTTPMDFEAKADWFDIQGWFYSEESIPEVRVEASNANLLLLLARGYWSMDFLQSVTTAYYQLVVGDGGRDWPILAPKSEVAPSPSGAVLTDGILALLAGLTANPEASEWAFVDFLPGSVEVEGTGYSIGRFTHFLMFDYEFPQSPEGSPVGESTTLTALSAAIESATWASDIPEGGFEISEDDSVSPMHDAAVLEALAVELTQQEGGCSWSPSDYWNCVVKVAKGIWKWVQQWGHLVLDLLTMAVVSPFPFTLVGVGAATANATWWAIEGNYLAAGLSLIAVVPGIAIIRTAAPLKAIRGAGAAMTAKLSSQAASAKGMQAIVPAQPNLMLKSERLATTVREGVGTGRVQLNKDVKSKILAKAPKDKDGNYLDANTGLPIPEGEKFDIGHKAGHEWKCIRQAAISYGWKRQQLIDYANNPELYQIESRSSNRSHRFEGEKCEPISRKP